MAVRAQPITVIVPVRRWWAWWLKLSWPLARRNPLVGRPLVKLHFIHMAHWGLWERTRRGGGERLPHPYLVFQSNYDGDAKQYIEHFSLKVPWRTRGVWAGSYGFPGPRPCAPFTDYVFAHQNLESHYHCAYPEDSARMVVAAQRLDRGVAGLRERAAGVTDESFARTWAEFVVEHQADL